MDIPALLDPDQTPALEAVRTPCKGRLMTCNRTADMFLRVSTDASCHCAALCTAMSVSVKS